MRLNFAIMFAVLFASLVAPAALTQVATTPELHNSVVNVDVQKEVPKVTDVSSGVRIVLNSNERDMADYKMSGVSDKIRFKPESGGNSMADYRLNTPIPGLQVPTEPGITIPDPGSNVPDVPPIYPDALCEYPIEITGDGAFVHPDGSVMLTADQPVGWHLDGAGLLEIVSSTKARYIPPRYFGGAPGIDVKVIAYKGFCRDEATIKVRAGPVEKMYMDYPSRVSPNQNKMVSLRVFDKYDNPVQGATISLALTPLGSADDTSLSADGIIGKKVAPKADETGAVSAYILAGTERGKYELTARYGLKTVTGVFEVKSASSGGHSSDNDDENVVVVDSTGATQPSTSESQASTTNTTTVEPANTTQPSASPQDSAAASLSISYPKKAYVGDVIAVRVTSGNTAVAGREVTITSPDGKSVKKKTTQVGYVEQIAEMEGRYAFQVDGAEKPVYVDVSAKPSQAAQPKANEPAFDIVGAFTGNAGALPVVALLVLLGVAVIGVAVYFLRKKEPE